MLKNHKYLIAPNSNLRNAKLKNYNLTSAKLANTDLRNSDLREANLTNADLRNANLSEANLRNTNLTNADLRDVDLRNVDLREANLTNANLINSNLTNADLTDANLTKVMAWVNQILNWRFHDVLREYRNQPVILSLDELDSCKNDSDKSTSKELSRVEKEMKEKFISESENEFEVSAVRNFVKNDPNEILQKTYIGEDKNANLQEVILMRLDNEKWDDISKKLSHPISRLSELYQRNIKKRKVIDYFRRYLQ
ncbi:MAG: pentapeptide repeat-containing protein [Rivularia sp. (in: cyanobacteria)]